MATADTLVREIKEADADFKKEEEAHEGKLIKNNVKAFKKMGKKLIALKKLTRWTYRRLERELRMSESHMSRLEKLALKKKIRVHSDGWS